MVARLGYSFSINLASRAPWRFWHLGFVYRLILTSFLTCLMVNCIKSADTHIDASNQLSLRHWSIWLLIALLMVAVLRAKNQCTLISFRAVGFSWRASRVVQWATIITFLELLWRFFVDGAVVGFYLAWLFLSKLTIKNIDVFRDNISTHMLDILTFTDELIIKSIL